MKIIWPFRSLLSSHNQHCTVQCDAMHFALCPEHLCPCFKRNNNNDRRVAIENEVGLFVRSKRKHPQCSPTSSLCRNNCATYLSSLLKTWVRSMIRGLDIWTLSLSKFFHSKYVIQTNSHKQRVTWRLLQHERLTYLVHFTSKYIWCPNLPSSSSSPTSVIFDPSST